jgi:hypothetical protein
MSNPELLPFYLLFGLLIASLIAVLNERFDQDEKPTDCDPTDAPIIYRDEDLHT